MKKIFETLEKTVNKSSINDFRKFKNNFSGVTKWFMTSDYCFDDEKKPNNVITFVIYPYIATFPQWFEYIQSLQKTDLKHCRSVSKEFCDFMHRGEVFSFSFILGKPNFLDKWKTPLCMKKMAEDYIEMLNKQWKVTTPHMTDHYCELEKKLTNLLKKMNEKNFNYKLLSRTTITIFFASYLRYLLFREVEHVDIFSWLSDRDKMIACYDSVYEVLYEITSHCLCCNYLPEEKHLKVKDMIPADVEKNMFYDEIVRVADFICGAISDQNLETGMVNKKKHCTLVEDVLGDNPNIVILKIGEHEISRVFHKKNT